MTVVRCSLNTVHRRTGLFWRIKYTIEIEIYEKARLIPNSENDENYALGVGYILPVPPIYNSQSTSVFPINPAVNSGTNELINQDVLTESYYSLKVTTNTETCFLFTSCNLQQMFTFFRRKMQERYNTCCMPCAHTRTASFFFNFLKFCLITESPVKYC